MFPSKYQVSELQREDALKKEWRAEFKKKKKVSSHGSNSTVNGMLCYTDVSLIFLKSKLQLCNWTRSLKKKKIHVEIDCLTPSTRQNLSSDCLDTLSNLVHYLVINKEEVYRSH